MAVAVNSWRATEYYKPTNFVSFQGNSSRAELCHCLINMSHLYHDTKRLQALRLRLYNHFDTCSLLKLFQAPMLWKWRSVVQTSNKTFHHIDSKGQVVNYVFAHVWFQLPVVCIFFYNLTAPKNHLWCWLVFSLSTSTMHWDVQTPLPSWTFSYWGSNHTMGSKWISEWWAWTSITTFKQLDAYFNWICTEHSPFPIFQSLHRSMSHQVGRVFALFQSSRLKGSNKAQDSSPGRFDTDISPFGPSFYVRLVLADGLACDFNIFFPWKDVGFCNANSQISQTRVVKQLSFHWRNGLVMEHSSTSSFPAFETRKITNLPPSWEGGN